MAPPVLLIAWHSQSGSCARLAGAALAGARRAEGADAEAGRCEDLGSVEVAAASGLLLVAAENAGRLAGGAKQFLDRVFYPSISRELMLPAAVLVSAGNDGRSAVADVERMLKGIPFTPATEPLIIRGSPGPEGLARAGELGEALATGLALGLF
ncbi:hypothetical protein [Pseudohaliea rubra]|nr:hypothetical protein [Pseudohaliea rubra]